MEASAVADSVDEPSKYKDLPSGRRAMDVIFTWLSTLLVAGVLLQVFFAGLGAFDGVGASAGHAVGYSLHIDLGHALSILAAVIFIVSLIARACKGAMIVSFIVLVLIEVAQEGLAHAGENHQWLGALHALDGMLILLLAWQLMLTSYRRIKNR